MNFREHQRKPIRTPTQEEELRSFVAYAHRAAIVAPDCSLKRILLQKIEDKFGIKTKGDAVDFERRS